MTNHPCSQTRNIAYDSIRRLVRALFFTTLLLTPLVTRSASLSVTPNTISNDYAGVISLQIGGINAGETVIIEEFSDFDGDGNVNDHDVTLKAFPLVDGEAMIFGGVTNLHVPGDLNLTAGNITANLYMGVLGFEQRSIGKHLYRVSSPTSRFAPVTVPFTITNSAYTCRITGQVKSSGTNVPYAHVILFVPSGSEGAEPVFSGATDSDGNYSINVPPGVYLPIAFKNNYVTAFDSAPMIALSSAQTVSTNLALTPASRHISGRVHDKDDSFHGLGGMLTIAESPGGQVTLAFTDRNGNFSIGVTPDLWEVSPDDASAHFLGYPGHEVDLPVDCTSGDVSGLSIPLPRAEAMIYGTVRTDTPAPLPGILLWGEETIKKLDLSPRTDQQGRYFSPVVPGTWNLTVDADENPAHSGYVYSEPVRGLTVQIGNAIVRNFWAKLAPYQISGSLTDTSLMPLDQVRLWAATEISGIVYVSSSKTDSSGSFSMRAFNGLWQVGVSCDDSEEGLASLGYQCVENKLATVANANAIVNFTAEPCSGLQITTTALPNGRVNNFYSQVLLADSCSSSFNWYLAPASGPLPPGISLQSNGQLTGTPNQSGTWSFIVQVDDGNTTQSKTLFLQIEDSGMPLDIITGGVPYGTNATYYSTQIQASGGQAPYTWSLTPGSGPLPAGLTLSANGYITGTPSQTGEFYFRARVTDAALATDDQLLVLVVYALTTPPNITTTSLPNGTVGASYSAHLQATGGQAPYFWGIAIGSASLPQGLSMNSGTGEVFGTPQSSGTFYFIVSLSDSALPTGRDEQTVSLTIDSAVPPTLGSPAIWTDGKFRFLVNGTQGTTYTIQVSTDMKTWNPLRSTNAPSNSFTFIADPPSGPNCFYRIVVGQ